MTTKLSHAATDGIATGEVPGDHACDNAACVEVGHRYDIAKLERDEARRSYAKAAGERNRAELRLTLEVTKGEGDEMSKLEDLLAAIPSKPRTTVKRFAADLKARIARAAASFDAGGSVDCATGVRHALGVVDAALSDYDVRDPVDYLAAPAIHSCTAPEWARNSQGLCGSCAGDDDQAPIGQGRVGSASHLPATPDPWEAVMAAATLKVANIMANRERFIVAWVDETGLLPSESEMVEQRHADGSTTVTVRALAAHQRKAVP